MMVVKILSFEKAGMEMKVVFKDLQPVSKLFFIGNRRKTPHLTLKRCRFLMRGTTVNIILRKEECKRVEEIMITASTVVQISHRHTVSERGSSPHHIQFKLISLR